MGHEETQSSQSIQYTRRDQMRQNNLHQLNYYSEKPEAQSISHQSSRFQMQSAPFYTEPREWIPQNSKEKYQPNSLTHSPSKPVNEGRKSGQVTVQRTRSLPISYLKMNSNITDTSSDKKFLELDERYNKQEQYHEYWNKIYSRQVQHNGSLEDDLSKSLVQYAARSRKGLHVIEENVPDIYLKMQSDGAPANLQSMPSNTPLSQQKYLNAQDDNAIFYERHEQKPKSITRSCTTNCVSQPLTSIPDSKDGYEEVTKLMVLLHR